MVVVGGLRFVGPVANFHNDYKIGLIFNKFLFYDN